jgi:DNA-binding response OmpR family regulator
VSNADKRALEVHVANLRRKLENASSTGITHTIETVRGVGYRLATVDDSPPLASAG